MKTTRLYEFQRDGVRMLRDADGRQLLSDEVGCGKTLQTLYYCWRYLPKDPPGPVVIVVPAHLRQNWRREAQKHLGLRVEVLYGEVVPQDKLPPYDPQQIYVLSYDVLTGPHWKARTTPPKNSWIAWLADLKPRILISDESHYLSNMGSARTRAFRWLARRTPRCILLTGTPLPNKPENLFSLLHILWPKEYPSHFDFCSTYTTPIKTPWGWQFRGARSLDLLHAELKGKMIRRRKVDVLKDLPAVTYSVVPIECDLREYQKAEADVVAWLTKQDAAAGARASKAVELARMNTLVQLAAKAKLEHVVRWVKGFLEESDGKLLLGCLHYAVTGALMAALKGVAVLVDGTMSEKQKVAAFDRFNLDASCRVLVGNIHAAGTGWSCTSASHVAFAELPWRPSDLTQFAGRIHGVERGIPGTAAQVSLLVAEGTIETELCQAIQRKNRWACAAIDGDPETADLDVFDQMRRALRAREK